MLAIHRLLRDRIRTPKDRFFATVFLGGGLLFVAMSFAGAAITGGLLVEMPSSPPSASTLAVCLTRTG